MSPLTEEAAKLVRLAADRDHDLAAARAARDEAIRAAYDAGASLRDIAGEVDLSVESVRKITMEDY